jgi:uncharacterized protein involved in outer membrane biogenesis
VPDRSTFFADFPNFMKWLKIGGVVLLLLVAALAAIPFFISLDEYVPALERELSTRLNEPVKIGGLRAAGLPLPHATVTGITIGKADDIKVGSVSVTPDLWSLASATKVVKSIEIEGLVLTQKAIDRIPAWTRTGTTAGTSVQPLAVRVESIRLDDVTIQLQKATFGPFDARLRLSAGGNPESMSITTRDGKLKAHLKPEKSSYVIDAIATGWKLPVGPAIHFDELVVKGVATQTGADLGDIRAKLYGGSVAGNLVIRWEKGIQLKGGADVSRVEIAPLLLALGRPANFSGGLTAKPVTFSASAAKPEQIADALRLETPFEVQNGVLRGVDVRKAATSIVSRDGGKGGETRFERLSGHLALDHGTRRLTRLNAVSGSLSADGNVTISPKDELSGRVNTTVKAASVTAASVPLNVAGTVASPLLFPTGGTMAGAAVGTAVLGPGVGTSVGAKVGQWTEGLFGSKDEKKKK